MTVNTNFSSKTAENMKSAVQLVVVSWFKLDESNSYLTGDTEINFIALYFGHLNFTCAII